MQYRWKLTSKTNGSFPVALVTKWVLELRLYAALRNSNVECVFIWLFFLTKYKCSYSESASGGRSGVVITEEYL